MGFFDRLAGKSAVPLPEGGKDPALAPGPEGGVAPRLLAAREKLEDHDLAGAMLIYNEVLAEAGERADVLVTISGDLGSTGHIPEIIELVAPRYDALRHGPATGLNLVQAYLGVRDAESAQHVLDILFSLKRPELEDRLHGFSNAIAELMQNGVVKGMAEFSAESVAPPAEVGVALVTISRPIWSYGLEAVTEALPPKGDRVRRVAFAQLSLPDAYADPVAASKLPEDDLGRMSRAIPLWLAESFYFSPLYSSVAALGCLHEPNGSKHPAIFPSDWTPENLRKLVESAPTPLDYIFTGSLHRESSGFLLHLRVWEVRKMRERKQITLRWNPANADSELKQLEEYLRTFMEWVPYPEGTGIPYSPPASPTVWLDALAGLLGLFLVEKNLLPREQLAPVAPVFDAFAPHAFSPPASSLAWVSLRLRATALGLQPPLSEVLLSRHPAVAHARTLIGA
jgi:hypothetical protein